MAVADRDELWEVKCQTKSRAASCRARRESGARRAAVAAHGLAVGGGGLPWPKQEAVRKGRAVRVRPRSGGVSGRGRRRRQQHPAGPAGRDRHGEPGGDAGVL